MTEVGIHNNIIHDITSALVTQKNVIRFPDVFFQKKISQGLDFKQQLNDAQIDNMQLPGDSKLQKLVIPVNLSLTINNIKSIDIQNMNADANTVITLGVYYGWLGDSEQYRCVVDLLRQKIILELSNDENIRLTINNNFVEVVQKRNERMLVFTVRKNIDGILAQKVFFTPIEKLHLLFSIKIQSIYEPQIQQYIEQVYDKIQKESKQLMQSEKQRYKSKIRQIQKQQKIQQYFYKQKGKNKTELKLNNDNKQKLRKISEELQKLIIKIQQIKNQKGDQQNKQLRDLREQLKIKLKQKQEIVFQQQKQVRLMYIQKQKQTEKESYNKLKTLIIKFSLMNFTKNKQLNENNTAPQIYFGDQLNIGEYQIDTKQSITQISVKSYPQNIITTLELHYLYSMIDSYKKQKQCTKIDKNLLPILQEKKNKLRVHNYVHASITLFRHPIVTFLTVILPLIFISFVNLASFGIHTGKDGENIKRLLVLVTSIVAYIGLIPVLRSKIPPSDKPTLIQILVFAQLIPSLAALAQVIKYRQESAPQYTIQFIIGITITAMIVIFSICAMLTYAFVFYKRFRSSYKTVNPAQEKYLCDQKLWQNVDFRNLLKFMQFYQAQSQVFKQESENSSKLFSPFPPNLSLQKGEKLTSNLNSVN